MEDHMTEPTDYTNTCGNNDNLQSNKRMKVTTTSTTAFLSNKKKKTSKLHSLGSIFHYLEGMILMVELKNGTMYVGSLLSSGSSSDMNMMLSNVMHINNNNDKNKNNNTDINKTSIQTNKHINQSKLLQYYNQVLAVSQQQQQRQQQQQVDLPNHKTTSIIDFNNQPPKQDRPSSSYRTRTVSVNTITLLQTVYIRGSTIRYIHFIDTSNSSFSNINHMIQQGIRREKYGQQLYQRNTLRMKKR